MIVAHRDVRIGGLSLDRKGRLLVVTMGETRRSLLRLRRDGGIDRSFGRRGRARLPRGAFYDTAAPPPATAAVDLPDGPAVGITVDPDPTAAVAFLTPRGRLRAVARTSRTRSYPATIPLDLARDSRGRLLLAGARYTDDDPFYRREDYGTPYPTVWRIRPR